MARRYLIGNITRVLNQDFITDIIPILIEQKWL